MLKTINNGRLPTRGSKYSACVDLYANEEIVIGVGETKKIPLGITLDYNKFPLSVRNNMKKYYLELNPRSSMMSKNGLIGNIGIIDIDYKGEICMIFHKPMQRIVHQPMSRHLDEYIIKKGQRIAQITLLEHKGYYFNIDTEEKRNGGFGSTDKEQSNVHGDNYNKTSDMLNNVVHEGN